MKAIKLKDEFSQRRDHILMAVCLLGILLLSVPLFSDHVLERVFREREAAPSGLVLGSIAFSEKDIRHKDLNSLAWRKASRGERVRLGDSVFTGQDSRARIDLGEGVGGSVTLDQNSLITFATVDGVEVPNLALGNFRLRVDGRMKIAVDGVVTEIEGNGSELQVTLDSSGAKFHSLSGAPRYRSARETQRRHGKPKLTMPFRNAVTIEGNPSVFHLLTVGDLYRSGVNGLEVIPPSEALTVKADIRIDWKLRADLPRVFGQLSRTADFAVVHDFFSEQASAGGAFFTSAFAGQNFYRLSPDGKTWEPPRPLHLQTGPLKTKPPVMPGRRTWDLLGKDVLLELKPRGESSLSSFVAEVSPREDFPPDGTQARRTGREGLRLRLAEEQVFFIRWRGVNSLDQVTAFSEPVRIQVRRPSLPLEPSALSGPLTIYEDQDLELSWRVPTRKSWLELRNAQEQDLIAKEVPSGSRKIQGLKEGSYRVRIFAVDEFGRKSNEARTAEVRVLKREPAPPLVAREPTNAAGTLNYHAGDEIPIYLNQHYSDSTVAFEGAGFTMFSKEQSAQHKPNPVAVTLGLRWLAWNGPLGFEGAGKFTAAQASDARAGSVAPQQMEGRLHYRFGLPFSPFSGLGTSQASIVLGYEHYRNSAGGLYSPGYDVMKTGLNLRFPLLSRWDTGGELLYGWGFEQSKKYEISGFIGYYLRKDWSLGAGYRAHLFEAGSVASSPLGLPYREAFGEAYSTLKWSY